MSVMQVRLVLLQHGSNAQCLAWLTASLLKQVRLQPLIAAAACQVTIQHCLRPGCT